MKSSSTRPLLLLSTGDGGGERNVPTFRSDTLYIPRQLCIPFCPLSVDRFAASTPHLSVDVLIPRGSRELLQNSHQHPLHAIQRSQHTIPQMPGRGPPELRLSVATTVPPRGSDLAIFSPNIPLCWAESSVNCGGVVVVWSACSRGRVSWKNGGVSGWVSVHHGGISGGNRGVLIHAPDRLSGGRTGSRSHKPRTINHLILHPHGAEETEETPIVGNDAQIAYRRTHWRIFALVFDAYF